MKLPPELIQAVGCVSKALNELQKISYKAADQGDISEHVGSAKGLLLFAVGDFENFERFVTEPEPETDATPIDVDTFDGDATPIDVDTFDGDAFNEKRDVWIVATAFEMGFEFDYQDIANDHMEDCNFIYTRDGWLTGKHEYGSDGWNDCVQDFWNDTMDAADKANYIIKKDSEEKK